MVAWASAPTAPREPLYPVDVPPPEPRPIWTDRSGHYRVAALDWADGAAASYQALVRHGALWQEATGPELWRLLVALAGWLDGAGGDGKGSAQP